MIAKAMPNAITIAATTPINIASPPEATNANTRRMGPGRRYAGVS